MDLEPGNDKSVSMDNAHDWMLFCIRRPQTPYTQGAAIAETKASLRGLNHALSTGNDYVHLSLCEAVGDTPRTATEAGIRRKR